ncbi:MAG TPA: putative lipid II flippase FtsW [Verrucomicrobiae bacterium]|nr:putative lipid II flippase FtsW [Verrucomicrobiae bacterium]
MIRPVDRWLAAAPRARVPDATRLRALAQRVQVDPWLVLLTATLCAFGLVMVYAASASMAAATYGNASLFFHHQLLWMGLGTVALVVGARVDYHRWTRHAGLVAAGMLLLLLAVLVPHVGVEVLGARRWIHLGPIDLQPSVVAQLGVLIAGAAWLESRTERLHSFVDGAGPFMVRLVVVAGLVYEEKDLGSTMLVVMIGMVLLVAAGVRWRQLALMALSGIGVGVLLIKAEPYRVQRYLAYLHPFAHPLGSGYQAVQALYALGSGGVVGLGFGQSLQRTQWLPEAHTDFIFAIIGEQLGLIGSLLVLALFVAFAVRGLQAARNAPDRLGVLLASGITVWLTGQALLNIGGVTDSIPSTGVPLPFISYGGSALAVSMAATGILLNISAHARRRQETTRARRDRGWRDRRPHHPGAGGGGGAELG